MLTKLKYNTNTSREDSENCTKTSRAGDKINFQHDTLLILFITLITLITGIWWFLLGNGEKRLEKVFNEYR